MITVTYDDGGVQRSLDLAIDSLADLKPIFVKFTAWLRPEIRKGFTENSWEPLSAETLANRASKMDSLKDKIRNGVVQGVSRRLAAEQLRAFKRYARAENRGVGKMSIKSAATFLARNQRTQRRHEVVRSEFERIKRGEAGDLRKEAKNLPERLLRAVKKAGEKIEALESGRALGRIENSFTAEYEKGAMTYGSVIPWAGAHNEGATVGHGAKLPKREFLAWTPARIAKLAEIAQEHMLAKLKGKDA